MPAPNTYYELLEVSANASFDEIETSYRRLSSVVTPGSLALYSMFDEDEVQRHRAQLEEAYRTLSDPDRRAAYDRARAGGESGYPSVMVPRESHGASLSFGHVGKEREEEPVVDVDAIFRAGGAAPESYDYEAEEERPPAPRRESPAPAAPERPAREGEGFLAPSVDERPIHQAAPIAPRPAAPSRRLRLTPSPDVEINLDGELSGSVLRRLRQSCPASLEEVAEITKISKRYIIAIEENDFDSLPAAVYVRGFVCEYARVLGLDPQRVAQSYMTLYKRYKAGGT